MTEMEYHLLKLRYLEPVAEEAKTLLEEATKFRDEIVAAEGFLTKREEAMITSMLQSATRLGTHVNKV